MSSLEFEGRAITILPASCSALTEVLVHEDIDQDFIEALVRRCCGYPGEIL